MAITIDKLNKTILYIDDEQANLDGFMFNFRKDYNIFLAKRSKDAYDIIRKNKIKIVLSDNRMPDMQGTEFFEMLAESHPDIIRILVTAYADTAAVMEALNKGKVYKFITKPWNKNELKNTLDNALDAYDLKHENLALFDNLTSKNKELEDLSFKLMIEVAERSKAEEELANHKDNLEKLIEQRTCEIEAANIELAKLNEELVSKNERLFTINEELEVANSQLNKEMQARGYAQELLAESENKFRGLIEQSSEGIILIDAKGIIIDCNKAVEVITEMSVHEIIGNSLFNFDSRIMPSNDRNDNKLKLLKNQLISFLKEINNGESKTIESYCETVSGKIKYINSVFFPVITPKGKFIGRIFSDFTESKKSEEQLRLYKEELEELVRERTTQLIESEQRLRTLSDNLPGGAIFRGYTDEKDHDHLFYASAQLSELSGMPLELLLNNLDPFFSKIHTDDAIKFFEARRKGLDYLELMDVEVRFLRQVNDLVWIHLRIMYKRNDDGLVWWDGYAIDITNRKKAEESASERDMLINNIQDGISSKTGEKLFETISLKLSETLNVQHIFIAELSENEPSVLRTLSFCSNNKIIDNTTIKINTAPFNNLIKNVPINIASGVNTIYPDNKLLKQFKIEGLIGVPLYDSQLNIIGVMVVMSSNPIENLILANQLLNIFSSRVGAEIERIKAESGLKEREERFRKLFEITPNLMIISKPDGSIIEVNSALLTMSGFTHQEILNKTIFDLGIIDDHEKKSLIKYYKGEIKAKNIETYWLSKSGQIHYILLSIEQVIINGEPALLSTATDITKRKEAEVAIQQYSYIAQNMQVGLNVFYLEKNTKTPYLTLLKANPAAASLFGVEEHEILGKKFSDIYPMLVGYELEKQLISVIINDLSYENEEFRFFTTEGKTFFYSFKAFKVPTNCVCILFEDITDKKRDEKALRENEERYKALFEKSPNGIHLIDIRAENAGKIVSVNPKVQEMLGYNFEELIGKPSDEILRDLTLEKKKEQFAKLMAGETITYETNFYNKHDIPVPVEVTSSIISLGDHLYILGVDRDISVQKKSEQLIKENEQKFFNIFNSSSDGILISDFNLNALEINQGIINIVGYELNELKEMKPIDFVVPEYHEIILDRFQRIINNEKVPNIDIELVNKNGNLVAVDINSKAISYGNKMAILSIIRDITERRLMEKKLFETIISTEEKEREKFAGNLHDEVGPILSSLKMYVSLLAETEDKKKKDYIIPQIQLLIKESITAVREISNDLSPHVLNNYGCVSAINAFLVLKRDFVPILFSQNLENRRFEPNIEIMLYRIVKELVNNTIKHAEATEINIKLFEEESTIKLIYFDNGKGFNIDSAVENAKGSIGLLNIMSRIKSVNGKYKISSAKDSGFQLELFIPLNNH
jgi:PAS domain S-box-containing protein